MQCKKAGIAGTVRIRTDKRRYSDPLRCVLLTNRFSGLLVELTQDHGQYRTGQQFQVAPDEFTPDEKSNLTVAQGDSP